MAHASATLFEQSRPKWVSAMGTALPRAAILGPLLDIQASTPSSRHVYVTGCPRAQALTGRAPAARKDLEADSAEPTDPARRSRRRRRATPFHEDECLETGAIPICTHIVHAWSSRLFWPLGEKVRCIRSLGLHAASRNLRVAHYHQAAHPTTDRLPLCSTSRPSRRPRDRGHEVPRPRSSSGDRDRFRQRGHLVCRTYASTSSRRHPCSVLPRRERSLT